MRKQIVPLMCCLSAFAIFGCSDGGTPAENESTVRARGIDANLQGRWVSNCIDAQMFGNSQKSEILIEGDRASQLTSVSAVGNCGETSVEVRQEAKLDRGAEVAPGVGALDIDIVTIKVKPVSDTGVSILNLGSGFCGLKTWVRGSEKDVTDRTGKDRCFPSASATLFDIYTVESDHLMFGEGTPTATASLRPAMIDRDETYSRQ